MSMHALREVSVWGPNVAALRRAVRLDPDGVAVVDERGSVTYRQLDRRSNAIAQGLRALGVQHTHVVAVMCRNRLQAPRPVEEWSEHQLILESAGAA